MAYGLAGYIKLNLVMLLPKNTVQRTRLPTLLTYNESCIPYQKNALLLHPNGEEVSLNLYPQFNTPCSSNPITHTITPQPHQTPMDATINHRFDIDSKMDILLD
jgi:hypothetical protein